MMMPRCGMLFYIYKYVYYTMILCDDKAMRWLCVWYTRIYIMILWWWDIMRTQWWLRSTTGSYGRPVIAVAYGEMLCHSIETVWEMVAREEWLGCQHDALPMFDIPESTPVWAQCIYFLDFKNIKTYMYYVFKSIYTGGLWPRPGPMRFKECFRLPMSF